ncbi:hypothetical protein [Paludibaculum fermentans]|uniref:hypothetical protein n=1 Tax=Paludibaculum fermentans TaxID=1473598 RepID=UPI003EBE7069
MNPSISKARRAGAIFAGFVFVVVTSTAADLLFHATGVFPPMGQRMSDPLFAFALAYRCLLAIAGSYLTSRLAPTWVLPQATVMGTVGLAVSTLGAAVTWNKGPEFGPHWYSVLLALSSLPCSWAGARLFLVLGPGGEASPAHSSHA